MGAHESEQCPDDASGLFIEVSLLIPTGMHAMYTARARRFGMSFTERLLFALVHVDGELYGGPDREIIIHDPAGGTDLSIKPIDPVHYT